MKKFLLPCFVILFQICQHVNAQELEPLQTHKTAENLSPKERSTMFADEMRTVLSLTESEYRQVLQISIEAANRVEKEKSKKQSMELTKTEVRKIRNEKLLKLEAALGKEKMGIWKKHKKSVRKARSVQEELLED